MLKSASSFALALSVLMAHANCTADDLAAGRQLFLGNGCANCHEIADKGAGPALKEIAKRYQGKKVVDEIADRIREGSIGRWGDGEAHPPQGLLEPAEARLVASWILNGAP